VTLSSQPSPAPASPALSGAPWRRYVAPALAGAIAAGVSMAVAELIAGIVSGAPSLVIAIGALVIDLQPPGAKDVVVSLFGTNDKLALNVLHRRRRARDRRDGRDRRQPFHRSGRLGVRGVRACRGSSRRFASRSSRRSSRSYTTGVAVVPAC